MGYCNVCGTETDKLYRTSIEGVAMDVCEKCASFGRVLSKIEPKLVRVEKEIPVKPEIEESIVKDYAKIVRNAREKEGLTQEDFAKKLNEKLSLMRAIENRQQIPNMKLAEKIEKMFDVILIEVLEETGTELKKPMKQGEITLGDMIKIRKKQE
jgi:putative transcription factor